MIICALIQNKYWRFKITQLEDGIIKCTTLQFHRLNDYKVVFWLYYTVEKHVN